MTPDLILQQWGIDSFRPLQREAILAGLLSRDSLVVMPTGSGKSLCYQAPAAISDGLTVVISPLISLMKDQVDKLQEREIPAAFLNSSQFHDEQVTIERAVVGAGVGSPSGVRLLYVAPERCSSPAFLALLYRCNIAAFVIDEAHCISQWGHDFRPDYAKLHQLRQLFPKVPIHAFTATATQTVRDEIIEQLQLRDPVVLVGEFDRPNLTYRVERRSADDRQIVAHVRQRNHQAGLIYCIRRVDTERLAGALGYAGIPAMSYHAGMDDTDRESTQYLFMTGQCNVVVATVAFGMGIDRPDIRWVVHAAMPSSIECYHQETGRAGRDGDPADCIMFYSPDDTDTWCNIFAREDIPKAAFNAKCQALGRVNHYSTMPRCRHQQLVEHFGQAYDRDNCGACDVCLKIEGRNVGKLESCDL